MSKINEGYRKKKWIILGLSHILVLSLSLIFLDSYLLMPFLALMIILYNVLLYKKILKSFFLFNEMSGIVIKSEEDAKKLFLWMVSDSICWQGNCKVRDKMIIFMSDLLRFWKSVDWSTSLRTTLVYSFWLILLKDLSKDKIIVLRNKYARGLIIVSLKMVMVLLLMIVLYNTSK